MAQSLIDEAAVIEDKCGRVGAAEAQRLRDAGLQLATGE
jgi:hypothetical protein